MATREERLLKLAEDADRDAAQLEADAKEFGVRAKKFAELAAKLRAQAAEARELAKEPGTRDTLTEGINTVKVNVNKTVTDEHRFNIAKGQKPGDRSFSRVLADHGYTQKSLSAKLEIAPALLSMYRKGKRPIPRDRAEEVERLTGWKATLRNWPGRIVS